VKRDASTVLSLGRSSARLQIESNNADLCVTVRGSLTIQEQLGLLDALLLRARAEVLRRMGDPLVASGQ
jgi:hypothetical protein